MISIIKMMEPGDFKDFFHTDLTDYFHSLGLNTLEKQSCDYTQVIALSKQE